MKKIAGDYLTVWLKNFERATHQNLGRAIASGALTQEEADSPVLAVAVILITAENMADGAVRNPETKAMIENLRHFI